MTHGHQIRLNEALWSCLLLALLVPLASAMTVSPGAVLQGESSVLALYTPGTHWSAGVSVEAGEGILVNGVEVSSPELLLVTVRTEEDATLGARNISVEQNGEHIIGANALSVLNAGADKNVPGSATLLDVNVITNPGFETGDLSGWIPVTWSISTVLPHSGVYDAYDPGGSGGGGLCLRQEFNPPIDSNTITTFSFWLRQPDDFGIAQVAVFYQGMPADYGVIFTNDDDSWTFGQFPQLIHPNDFVTAIHVCGFGGGAPTPDDSWADDFDLSVAGETPVEQTSWGKIKSIYR